MPLFAAQNTSGADRRRTSGCFSIEKNTILTNCVYITNKNLLVFVQLFKRQKRYKEGMTNISRVSLYISQWRQHTKPHTLDGLISYIICWQLFKSPVYCYSLPGRKHGGELLHLSFYCPQGVDIVYLMVAPIMLWNPRISELEAAHVADKSGRCRGGFCKKQNYI